MPVFDRSPERNVDIAPSSLVYASSTDRSGACFPNLCEPESVATSSGRWASAKHVKLANGTLHTKSGSCEREWLDFELPSKVDLKRLKIVYGDLGDNIRGAPELSFMFSGSPQFSHYNGAWYFSQGTMESEISGSRAIKTHSFSFIPGKGDDTITHVRINFDRITPHGNFSNVACQIDVKQVSIFNNSQSSSYEAFSKNNSVIEETILSEELKEIQHETTQNVSSSSLLWSTQMMVLVVAMALLVAFIIKKISKFSNLNTKLIRDAHTELIAASAYLPDFPQLKRRTPFQSQNSKKLCV